MRNFLKVVLIVCTAIVVAVPGLAHAEVNPDDSFYDSNFHPDKYNWFRADFSGRGSPHIYYDSQPLDCDKASMSSLRALYVRETMVGSDSGSGYADYFESRVGFRSGGVANPYTSGSSVSGGRLGVYGSTHLDLSDFFPGDAAAGGPDLKNYGADEDPLKGTVGGTAESYNGMSAAEILGEAIRRQELNPGRTTFHDGTVIPQSGWPSRSSWLDAWEGVTSGELPLSALDQFRGSWRPITASGLDQVVEHPTEFVSLNVQTEIDNLPQSLEQFVHQQFRLGGVVYTTLSMPRQNLGDVLVALQEAGISFQNNYCRRPQVPVDPNYLRTGRNGGNSWGEKEDDQWAIKRVGFTADEASAWNAIPDRAAPVVVAVIDSGLDWHHLDINANNIWRNPAEDPDNGVDDDNNGYVDDVIGWDFVGRNNKPWDFDGHGTVVTGVIAAAHNDVGIAGINPNVKIMVLKAIGNLGASRASYIAEAIVYAADNGAQVVNISIGGPHTSHVEQAALDYAHQAGVLVVVASGNDGVELGDYGPGGADHTLTVGATHVNDRATDFSNYGDEVDIVAPGVDVLSLRARFTDANFRPGDQEEGVYSVGDNYVGDDKRYLHVSGTSFSAPIVAGIASLVWSKNPDLTAAQVEQILLQTATDVENPGRDKYTGHGMVDARAALSVDADFSVTAEISRVEIAPEEAKAFVRVYGTVDASQFKRAWMQIGPGENPGGWLYVGQKRKYPIEDGLIGTIPLKQFAGADLWQVVVNVEHKNGVVKSAAFPVTVK